MAWKTNFTVNGIEDFKLSMDRLQDGNYRRAVRRGLNSSLEIVREEEKQKAQTKFDRPTTYTLNAFKLKYASTANLEGKVYFSDPERLSESQHYLYPNVYGAKRGWKKFEAALYAKGILPKDYYCIPGRTTKLDQYGNVPASLIIEILAYLQAFPEIAGYKNNSTTATKDKKKKGTKKKFGYEFYILRKKKGRMLPGIYRKVYFSEDQTANYAVFIFVPKSLVGYQRHFEFYNYAADVFNKNFKPIFSRELEKLMSETIE